LAAAATHTPAFDALSEMTITLDNRDEVLLLFGSRDQNLRAIRDALGVRLVARGDTVQVDGPEDKVGQAEQVDLPRQMRSGLVDAVHRLRDLERIAIIYLNEHDIVRHPLVQHIVRAYEEDNARKK